MNYIPVLAIIGGGASGLTAAIEAARTFKLQNKAYKIIVFDKMPRVGKKILATGNGRCNLTNIKLEKSKYYGDLNFAFSVFTKVTVDDTLTFFKSLGLYTKTEEEGRVYPMSSQASAVLDALRFEAQKLNIEFITNTKIFSIQRADNIKGYILNKTHFSDCVIIATGGKSAKVHGSDGSGYPLLNSLNINITPLFPSLTGLILGKPYDSAIKGVRAQGRVKIIEKSKVIAEDEGEIQYNDKGISGIPVLQISRIASDAIRKTNNTKIFVEVDNAKDFTNEELEKYIKERIKNNSILLAEDILTGILPKKLTISACKSCGIKLQQHVASLNSEHITHLVMAIKHTSYPVLSTCGFDAAQVTAGGADTKDFNPKTMESHSNNGLYACGEVLNVDGVCGGYNLQWAWSSGILAGKQAARHIIENQLT